MLALMSALVFAIAAGIDTIATIRAVERGADEYNPMAAEIIARWGFWGFYIFGLLMVIVFSWASYVTRENEYAAYLVASLAVYRLVSAVMMVIYPPSYQ